MPEGTALTKETPEVKKETPQPIEEEMVEKKKEKRWLKPLLFSISGLILAAGLVFAGYKLGQRRASFKPVEGPTPTITPKETPTPVAVATPTPDPTANWKTYTNFFDDYEIKYPSGWFLYSAAEERSGADITDSDISRLELVPKPDDTKHLRVNLIAFANLKDLNLQDWLKENDKNIVESEVSISVRGVSGMKRIENNSEFLQLGEIKRTIAVYLPYQDKIYRILAFPSDSRLISTFDLILSTFKFLE